MSLCFPEAPSFDSTSHLESLAVCGLGKGGRAKGPCVGDFEQKKRRSAYGSEPKKGQSNRWRGTEGAEAAF